VDRILLEGMVFKGRHGVSDGERARTQAFRVDVELETRLARPGKTDRIADTVDYRVVRAIAKEVVEGEPQHLIESLAEKIASRALTVRGVSAVTVRIAKRPPSMRPIDSAAVQIRRARR
jgi:7,8-dihydroneopterin aldolase/epimerase/oxygenase